jgi:hypothetical protein
MTNEELEQKVKRLEEQLTEVRIELLERKAPFIPYKPYEVEVPTDIEDYYVLDGYGKVYSLKGFSMNYIRCQYQRGLAFKTREQAEQFKKEQILLFKLHKWAEEHNGGWTPNWNDYNEEKWTVMYHNECEEFEIYENYRYREFLKLPYFESEEIAELFIKEFGDEIKEVLC